jgi:exosome complex RNA-binding protein Csl4
LTGGASWDDVAKSLGLAAQPPQFVSRNDEAVPVEVRAQAFDEPKPAAQPVYTSVALKNGDSAVLEVSAVREDPSGDSTVQEAQLRRQFSRQTASAEAEGYAAAARADAKVSLNLQALD